MLQAVIYGFGVEPTDDGLKYNKGLLPKQWKSLKIIGLGPDNKTITTRNSIYLFFIIASIIFLRM
jgi:hypothetical protein